MTDTNEHHETRRKPQEIVDRSKQWQDIQYSWWNIGYVLAGVAAIGILFMLWGWIMPGSTPSNPPPASGNGTPPAGPVLGSLLLLCAIAFLAWLFTRARPAGLQATAVAWRPGIPGWVIALALIALVAVFHDRLLALFPFDTQVRLRTVENVLMDHILLTGFLFTALLLLLGQRSAAAVAGIAVVLAFFLMPDAQGFSRSDRLHAWWNAPPKRTVTAYSNPEVFRDAVAKKRSTPECPGTVKVLDASNPYYKLRGEWCMFYYRVLKGTFRVDGTNGWGNKAEPLIMSPNGDAATHNKQFYAREARLLTGDGEMQILECPTNSVQRNWQCWDR